MAVKSLNQFKILLIHSPLVNTSFPPLSPARVAGCLSASEVEIEQYDANLDFFQSQSMSSGQLYQSADCFQDIFKPDEFYQPDVYCNIMRNIKKQFENPDIDSFLDLCKNKLAEKLKHQDIKLIIIFASAPHQISAALTLSDFCKQHRPKVPLSVMGDLSTTKTAKKQIDKIIPRTNYDALFEFIAMRGGNIQPDYLAEPDFSGLPLGKYYAPSLVLPFSVSSVHDSSEMMPPETVARFIQKQATSYGTEGFVCEHDMLTTGYMYDLSNKLSRSMPGLNLAVSSVLDAPGRLTTGPSTAKEFTCQPCIKLIKWQVSEKQKDHPKDKLINRLLGFYKSGIWNHVDIHDYKDKKPNNGMLQRVVSNPNIINSWDVYRSDEIRFARSMDLAHMTTSYGKVRQLPGYPFWRDLRDPAHLLLYIGRYGVKEIIRMRTREDEISVYILGRHLEYHFVKPSELPPGYLDEICRMVEAGGSVGSKWIRYNLEKAFLIGYVTEEGVIVGNSSLKRPRPEYIEVVNQQSGLDLSQHLERGYTSVRPEYRGLGVGTKLLEGLTERSGGRKIFSVIGEDNLATKKIAIRNKTKQIASYYSKRMGKQLGIWSPEWMIAGSMDQALEKKEDK
ncbi:MAG: hypothetical protein QNK28_03990 [Desulfobacterales bacterium]|nr:hypothetical protein [Desulfobacterales bacterium]